MRLEQAFVKRFVVFYFYYYIIILAAAGCISGHFFNLYTHRCGVVATAGRAAQKAGVLILAFATDSAD